MSLCAFYLAARCLCIDYCRSSDALTCRAASRLTESHLQNHFLKLSKALKIKNGGFVGSIFQNYWTHQKKVLNFELKSSFDCYPYPTHYSKLLFVAELHCGCCVLSVRSSLLDFNIMTV